MRAFLIIVASILSLTVAGCTSPATSSKKWPELKSHLVNARQVTVDYGMPFDNAVAAGNYDLVGEGFEVESFPVSLQREQKTIQFQFLRFNGPVTQIQLRKEMMARGVRPATAEELLAYGATIQDSDRACDIRAVGSLDPYARQNAYKYDHFMHVRRPIPSLIWLDTGWWLYMQAWQEEEQLWDTKKVLRTCYLVTATK